jgi:hypothetical protein
MHAFGGKVADGLRANQPCRSGNHSYAHACLMGVAGEI